MYQSGETTVNGGDLSQTEVHIYGSSRLGIYNLSTDVQCNSNIEEITTFIRGNKFFELSNHLGNVLVTVSDRKIAVVSTLNTTLIDHYEAEVITANDYYPFGMGMVGRKYEMGGVYRYGYNRKENDDDIEGEGNEQDYGMRIYDTRLGRFLSIDPITKKYPELTPYQFSSNTPIQAVDLDGKEAATVVMQGRVTIPLLTGSYSVGAAVDREGNVSFYTAWSVGLGAGLYAGISVSVTTYPTATTKDIVGSVGSSSYGGSVAGSVSIGAVKAQLEGDVAITQNAVTNNINGVKLGFVVNPLSPTIGLGAELHADFSESTPFYQFNLKNLANDIKDIEGKISDATFLTDGQISDLLKLLPNIVTGLNQAKAEIDTKTAAQPQAPTATKPQNAVQSDTQAKASPDKDKAKSKESNSNKKSSNNKDKSTPQKAKPASSK